MLVHTEDSFCLDMQVDPDGRVRFLVAGRLLSSRYLPADTRRALAASGVFDSPRPIGLIGSETHSGIDAMFVAIVERDPGKARAPEADRPRVVVLGSANRTPEERAHGSVVAELHDMLRDFVDPVATLTLEQQAIENLLSSL